MGAFDKRNASGLFDPHEPSLTDDELAAALAARQERCPPHSSRRDHCPHSRLCASVADCVEKIAWYLRHQDAIEAAIASGDVAGFE